jgi:hypothetical protein
MRLAHRMRNDTDGRIAAQRVDSRSGGVFNQLSVISGGSVRTAIIDVSALSIPENGGEGLEACPNQAMGAQQAAGWRSVRRIGLAVEVRLSDPELLHVISCLFIVLQSTKTYHGNQKRETSVTNGLGVGQLRSTG